MEEINFEKELARLNEIVKIVQDSKTSLEESLKLYEEGSKIIAILEKELKNTEEKIEYIIKENKGEHGKNQGRTH